MARSWRRTPTLDYGIVRTAPAHLRWLVLLGPPEFGSPPPHARLAIRLPSGFLLIDVSGKIVLANEPIAQMLGYSTTERQGISIEELVPLAVQPGPPELRRELMPDPAPKRLGMGRQLKALTKSGVELPVEVGIGPDKPRRNGLCRSSDR